MHRCPLCILILLLALVSAPGCHDGPLYALKTANPYFTRQWAADEALGVTDHQRMENLRMLCDSIHRMPAAEQSRWLGHLQSIMEHDRSAEMRFLAVRSAQRINGDAALQLIADALDDESVKVRMAACDVLGQRGEPQAARLLAETVNSSVDPDVRLAAIRALQGHQGQIVNDTLKLTLKSDDPAARYAAIESLRTITGQDLGSQPEAWLAYLDGQGPAEPQPTRFAERLRKIF